MCFSCITKQVKLHPKPPVSLTTTSPIRGNIHLNQRFSSISSVCFHFIFQDDLLDVGDSVTLFSSGEDIGGFFNTVAPQSERVICLNPSQNPIFSNLLDGKDDLTITGAGSLTISSLIERRSPPRCARPEGGARVIFPRAFHNGDYECCRRLW